MAVESLATLGLFQKLQILFFLILGLILTTTSVGRYLINLGSYNDTAKDPVKIRWFMILLSLAIIIIMFVFMFLLNIVSQYMLFVIDLFALAIGEVFGLLIYLSLNLDMTPEKDPEEELIEYLKKYKEEENSPNEQNQENEEDE